MKANRNTLPPEHNAAFFVAAGLRPAVEPGVPPGGHDRTHALQFLPGRGRLVPGCSLGACLGLKARNVIARAEGPGKILPPPDEPCKGETLSVPLRSLAFLLLAILLLAATATSPAQSLSIRTMAGGSSTGSTNGFGSNARFNHLCGIAADSSGNVYIADTDNHTIRKISPTGLVSLLAGQPGVAGRADGPGANARFNAPQGLAVNAAGTLLYVADSANGTIRKVTPSGLVSTYAGVAGDFNSLDGSGFSPRFYHPEAVALDAGGNLYVSDTWNHTIRKITPAGAVTTLAGLAGNFGATDSTNSRARFYRPTGLALDSTTNIFVADSFNHVIRKITPTGKVTTIAGLANVWGSADGTNSTARFYLPQGISVTAGGEVLVADSGNQTLRRITPSGTNWIVTTVAGLNGLAGNANGTGTGAAFYFPTRVALDAAGYVYVADSANNEVRTTRVISPTLQQSGSVLYWPTSSDGFILERSTSIGPSASWLPATNGTVVIADNFVRTNTPGTPGFYRLRFP